MISVESFEIFEDYKYILIDDNDLVVLDSNINIDFINKVILIDDINIDGLYASINIFTPSEFSMLDFNNLPAIYDIDKNLFYLKDCNKVMKIRNNAGIYKIVQILVKE